MHSSFCLFPGAEPLRAVLIRRFTASEVDDITQKRKIIYVVARVDYTDVFGFTHWTRAAAKYQPRPAGRFVLLNKYNEAN